MGPTTAEQLVAKLRKQQVNLHLEGDTQLRLVGNTLSSDLLDEVRNHKQALIEFLKTHQSCPLQPSTKPSDRVVGGKQYADTSFLQRKEFVLSQIKKDGNFFNLQFLLQVESISEEVLLKVLGTIVDRHEALRTSFEIVDGVLMQVIQPKISVQVRYVDVCSDETGDVTIRQITRQENETPFMFSQAPLWRILCFRHETHRRSFLFTFHHVIADHASLRLLREELILLYRAFDTEQTNPLPPVRGQYRNYVDYKNNLLYREPHRSFWKAQLTNGLLPLMMGNSAAADTFRYERSLLFQEAQRRFNRLGLQDDACLYECVDRLLTPDGGSVHLRIDKSLLTQLETTVDDNELSLFSLLAGGLSLLFYRLCGQKRLMFTFPVVARHQELFVNVFGWVTGGVICTTSLQDETQSVSAFLRDVDDLITQSYEYSDYPFQGLYKELSIPAEEWVPLSINYIDFENSQMPAEPTQVSSVPVKCIAYHDLSLEFGRYADGMTMTMYYKTDFFSITEAEHIMNNYCSVLQSLASKQQLTISAFKQGSI